MVSEPTRTAKGIDADAAAWLARLHGPYRSADTDSALKTWLKADAAHESAFERATEIWDMIAGAAWSAEALPDDRPRRSVLAAAVAALALVIAGTFAFLARPPVHQTQVGGQQVVILDDGTRISLNTDSRVAVLYSDSERLVRLERGEGLFEVARSPDRPFIVQAGDQHVRALGTTFLVRRDGGRTAVTLLDGRVEVAGPARVTGLSPGERVTLTEGAGAALDRPPIGAVAAWRRGEIVFEDTSLLEAAGELNRYSRSQILLSDSSLASLRVSGVFSTSDVGEAAETIAELHRLRIVREGDELRLARD